VSSPAASASKQVESKNNNNNNNNNNSTTVVVKGFAWRLRCCCNSTCTLRVNNYPPNDKPCFINRDANGSCNIRAIGRYAAWKREWPKLQPVEEAEDS
jgi:hypothetical protein